MYPSITKGQCLIYGSFSMLASPQMALFWPSHQYLLAQMPDRVPDTLSWPPKSPSQGLQPDDWGFHPDLGRLAAPTPGPGHQGHNWGVRPQPSRTGSQILARTRPEEYLPFGKIMATICPSRAPNISAQPSPNPT